MTSIPAAPNGIKAFIDKRDIRQEPLGKYYLKTWNTYFADDEDFQNIVTQFPGPISRSVFAEIGKQGVNSARQLFLATMLWGFGTIGYGAWRTMTKMLRTENAIDQLKAAFQYIVDGRIADAYCALHLERCGPAFMTKYLYGIGLSCQASPLPIILDSRVAGTLRRLLAAQDVDHRSYFKLASDGMVERDPDGLGYVKTVMLLNDWAAELGVRADDIEVFLFNQ